MQQDRGVRALGGSEFSCTSVALIAFAGPRVTSHDQDIEGGYLASYFVDNDRLGAANSVSGLIGDVEGGDISFELAQDGGNSRAHRSHSQNRP